MEAESKFVNDIVNSVLICLIGCKKAIDAINYYQISNMYKELGSDLQEILEDSLYAFISEGIIVAHELLINETSTIHYIKIKNKINNGKLNKSSKLDFTNMIDDRSSKYKNSQHYLILTDQKYGIAFLRDKVFAHTDNKGLFVSIKKKVVKSLYEILKILYELHRELLINLSTINDSDNAQATMASTQPTIREYCKYSKNKADLLKKLFK